MQLFILIFASKPSSVSSLSHLKIFCEQASGQNGEFSFFDLNLPKNGFRFVILKT